MAQVVTIPTRPARVAALNHRYRHHAAIRVLGDALDYLGALPLKDRPAFMGAAAKRGYLLTLAEEECAQEARDVLLSELAANE